MFNSQRPSIDDLPTNGQLLRATALAAATAGVLLVAVVLPAEYAIDPTGAGRALGFTEMGEIKAQLAREAETDRRLAASSEVRAVVGVAPTDAVAPSTGDARSDVTEVTLAPGEGAEVKATMAKGKQLAFDWSVRGGAVNFDTHADGAGIDYHGYGKGRNSQGEKGTLVAAFDGKHGWFWRNRSGGSVTVTLRTQGGYTDIKRVV